MRVKLLTAVLIVTMLSGFPAEAQVDLVREEHLMSSMGIVGFDPDTGEVGVASASRVFAVGYVMTHVRAGVGAIAAMGGAPYKDGSLMLDWMEEGETPAEVLDRLRERYDNIGQLSIVDVEGRSAAVTNPNSSEWKGHRIGKNYAASGNILAGPDVVDGFANTFESTEGSGLPLAERLLRALEAADRAGGDARGRLGAALQVYKSGAGFRGTDILVDLRVDDSPNAIDDLRYLFERWRVERAQEYGARMILQTHGADVALLQKWLLKLGYVRRDDAEVFEENGKPRGIFNDATVAAVLRFKEKHGLGSSRAANRETVVKMIDILEDRLRGQGATSFWKDFQQLEIVRRKEP